MSVISVEMKISEDGNSVFQDVSIAIMLPTYYFLPNLFENPQSSHVLVSMLWSNPYLCNDGYCGNQCFHYHSVAIV